MSTANETDSTGIGTRVRGSLLALYGRMRSRPWVSIIVFGILLHPVGLLLGRLDIHPVFAGMMGIWGTSFILFGLAGYLLLFAIRYYGKKIDEGV